MKIYGFPTTGKTFFYNKCLSNRIDIIDTDDVIHLIEPFFFKNKKKNVSLKPRKITIDIMKLMFKFPVNVITNVWEVSDRFDIGFVPRDIEKYYAENTRRDIDLEVLKLWYKDVDKIAERCESFMRLKPYEHISDYLVFYDDKIVINYNRALSYT
jgi:hypothetical protein